MRTVPAPAGGTRIFPSQLPFSVCSTLRFGKSDFILPQLFSGRKTGPFPGAPPQIGARPRHKQLERRPDDLRHCHRQPPLRNEPIQKPRNSGEDASPAITCKDAGLKSRPGGKVSAESSFAVDFLAILC